MRRSLSPLSPLPKGDFYILLIIQSPVSSFGMTENALCNKLPQDHLCASGKIMMSHLNESKSSYALTYSLFLLILLGFVWGTGYSIARFAVTNGVPPFGYSFWQSLGPALVIGLICFYRSKKTTYSISSYRFYLFCGLMGICLPNTVMYVAASHLPASILAMVVNIVPIIAYPLALCARLESFSWVRLSGICLASLGLMLIILPKSSLPAPNLMPWVLLSLVTPVSFAICSIYIAKFRPKHSDSLLLSAGMLIASSFLLIPMVLYTHNFYFFHLPLSLPDWVILLEIFLSSLGYILFFKLIKLAGPVYYSLVDTVVVLTGIFWGYILFDEHLNKWTGTAVFLILFALILVTQQQKTYRKLTANDRTATSSN